MPDHDPWNWTSDDLVNELCSSRSLFNTVGCSPEFYPDAENLEEQIRIHRITGQSFLTALNPQTLRYDLGISSLGERIALATVLKFLQGQSIKYKQHIATAGVNSLSIHSDRPSDRPTGIAAPEEHARKRGRAVLVTNIPPSTTQSPTQAQIVTPEQGHIVQRASTTGAPGEWDHLLRWAQADVDEDAEAEAEEQEDDWTAEELVDADDYDVPADVAEEDTHEYENDVNNLPTGSRARAGRLSQEQIVDVINESIERYTNAWTPGKDEIMTGLEVQESVDRYNPDRLWEDAEATGQRQVLARRHESQAQYFRQRLDELCDEILKFPETNIDAVRLQCRNLEVTVDSLEHAKWLVSIYKLEPVDDSDEESTGSEGIADMKATQGSKTHPAASTEIIDLDSPPNTPGPEHDHISPTQSSNAARAEDGRPRFTPTEVRSTTEMNCEVVATSASLAQAFVGDVPENASIATVRRWKWKDLVETQDRKRVVSKAVYEMSSESREMIRSRLQFMGRVNMVREIPVCIAMLVRGDQRMQGVLPRDSPKIITFTKLFLCWWLCDNYFQEAPSQWNLEELVQCLEGDSPDPTTFCDYLNTIMATTFSPDALEHPERPSQAEVITISDDEDDIPHRPVKRRKSSTIIVLD